MNSTTDKHREAVRHILGLCDGWTKRCDDAKRIPDMLADRIPAVLARYFPVREPGDGLQSHRCVADCIVNPLKDGWPNLSVPAIAEEVIVRHVDSHVRAAMGGEKPAREPGEREREIAERPKRICLCGSTRFKRAWLEWNARLTLEERAVVLTVAMWSHSQRIDPTPEQKILLDEIHKAKIDASDEIFVLDVGGYIGDSTRSEIEHAKKASKRVRYLSQEFPEWTESDCVYAESAATVAGGEEVERLKDVVRRLINYVVTCEKRNQNGWMQTLAKRINEAAREIGDRDRIELHGTGFEIIRAATPAEQSERRE